MTAVAEPVAAAGAGGEPGWLAARRAAGVARFARVGYPTTRDEDWRFTPLGAVAQTAWRPAPVAEVAADALKPFVFGHPEWSHLVFVNGHFAPALSAVTPAAGVQVGRLADAVATGDATVTRWLGAVAPVEASALVAQNTAEFADGAFVRVAAGTQAPHPVHLVFVTTPEAEGAAVHPRTLVVVEREARLDLVESYVALPGATGSFTNTVCEVVVGANAVVEHARIQREAEGAHHVGYTRIEQERDSHYRSFTLSMGGALARHDLDARLGASNVETLMYGLYLGRGEQLVDNHTAIHHDHPDCRSWEVYKGILDGRSRGVFNGKIFVKPEAQKTDAKQTNRALLLSPDARVDTKPQLEIFADDVKCTHGATVGYLDPMPLFYATSRGVPAARAQQMLTYAFCCEVTDEVRLEPVRLELERLVRDRLGIAD